MIYNTRTKGPKNNKEFKRKNSIFLRKNKSDVYVGIYKYIYDIKGKRRGERMCIVRQRILLCLFCFGLLMTFFFKKKEEGFVLIFHCEEQCFALLLAIWGFVDLLFIE